MKKDAFKIESILVEYVRSIHWVTLYGGREHRGIGNVKPLMTEFHECSLGVNISYPCVNVMK